MDLVEAIWLLLSAAAKFVDLVDKKFADLVDEKLADLVDEKLADLVDENLADLDRKKLLISPMEKLNDPAQMPNPVAAIPTVGANWRGVNSVTRECPSGTRRLVYRARPIMEVDKYKDSKITWRRRRKALIRIRLEHL
jgi:gamma-glutamyl phosphate reductase